MIYRQSLVMRNALLWCLGIIGCITAIWLVTFATRQVLICGHNTLLSAWVLGASYGAALFAAIYGVGLGNASREGSRIFWVLPQGRLRTALSLVAVDAAGIVAVLLLMFLATVVIMSGGIALQHTQCQVTNDLDARTLSVALGFPFALYGWTTLTGMLLRRVAYMGVVFLPLGLLWFAFSHLKNDVGALLRAIAFANPVSMVGAMGAWQLWGIVIGTLVLALALWQRAEVVT